MLDEKMKNKLFKRATNPLQYDFDDIFWDSQSGLKSPKRNFFYEYLSKYKKQWVGADILDIGCGTGWLVDLFIRNGANLAEGIEPSEHSVKIAKTLFPDIKIYHCDFNSFQFEKQYDLITAVMVLNHIGDLKATFKKINKLLKSGGELQIVVPDYQYFGKRGHGHKIEIERLNSDEYAAQDKDNQQGSIADIVRKMKIYKEIAENSGLKFIEHIKMYPTKSLIKHMPQYAEFKDEAITHLLRFKK